MHEGEKEAAVVVLRAEDVHQVRFYCNQMSIAQSSSFKRNMNINCRQIWMVTQLSGETCPLGTKPDSHFVLFIQIQKCTQLHRNTDANTQRNGDKNMNCDTISVKLAQFGTKPDSLSSFTVS